jgi:AcrR family transcriptional regulator
MARPQTATDEEILSAARDVLERRGHDGFTLSEVADLVGLSRAAITLRFKNALHLKVRVMETHMEQSVKLLSSLPTSPSGESLIEMAAFLGGLVKNRSTQEYATLLSVLGGNLRTPELAQSWWISYGLLARHMGRCMPDTAIPKENAIASLFAYLFSVPLISQNSNSPDLSDLLASHTKIWLKLAHIPFDADYQPVWAKRLLEQMGADAPAPRNGRRAG